MKLAQCMIYFLIYNVYDYTTLAQCMSGMIKCSGMHLRMSGSQLMTLTQRLCSTLTVT